MKKNLFLVFAIMLFNFGCPGDNNVTGDDSMDAATAQPDADDPSMERSCVILADGAWCNKTTGPCDEDVDFCSGGECVARGTKAAGESCEFGDEDGTVGFCDGESAACQPICKDKPSGTICRPANGSCDVPERCTGESDECPTDAFEEVSAPCQLDGQDGECNPEGECVPFNQPDAGPSTPDAAPTPTTDAGTTPDAAPTPTPDAGPITTLCDTVTCPAGSTCDMATGVCGVTLKVTMDVPLFTHIYLGLERTITPTGVLPAWFGTGTSTYTAGAQFRMANTSICGRQVYSDADHDPATAPVFVGQGFTYKSQSFDSGVWSGDPGGPVASNLHVFNCTSGTCVEFAPATSIYPCSWSGSSCSAIDTNAEGNSAITSSLLGLACPAP